MAKIKCQTGADSGNPRLCSESGSNLYGVYQVRYAFYTSLVCFFNHYLSYCFLIQLERFLFPSPVLVYYLVRFLSRAPVSLPLFSVQRDSGGWTCVFSFSLLLKLAFSCRLRGWALVVSSEAVWKQRPLLFASGRMCEVRQGEHATHQHHTMLTYWVKQNHKQEGRRGGLTEEWLCEAQPLCLLVISAQGWRRTVRSQRPLFPLSGLPSNLKPDLSMWGRKKRKID